MAPEFRAPTTAPGRCVISTAYSDEPIRHSDQYGQPGKHRRGSLRPRRIRRVRARRLRQRRWRCVTGAADRRRRDRRRCPCQRRAGELCTVRGKAPLLICPGAASRRGLPYGGSVRVSWGSTRWRGHRGRLTGLRLRCGDRGAAAGGCHCASLMMKRRAAAAAVRPCVRPGPG